jgi:colanic acid biosynthesis glycosyl transferase WcaI
MRICIVSQYYPPDNNGDVVRLKQAMRILTSMGHEILVITAYPHYPMGGTSTLHMKPLTVSREAPGITVVRTFILPLPHDGFVNRFLLYTSFAVAGSFASIFARTCDVVWAFSMKVFAVAPSLLIRRLSGSRLMSDFTDIWPEGLVNTGNLKMGQAYDWFDAICAVAYRKSDLISTLTPAMSDMLRNHHGIEKAKVVIIPNASASVPSEPAAKSDDKFVIVYSGNIGTNYDFETVMRSAELLKEIPDLKLIVHGRGESAKVVSHLISSRGLGNVTYDSRLLSESDHSGLLEGADAFLLPMKDCAFPDASLPIKLVEYLRYGKPVVCTGAGFLKELIGKYGAGIVVDPGDYKALSEAVKTLVADRSRSVTMGQNARRLFADCFSIDRLRDGLNSAFLLLSDGGAIIVGNPS